MTRRPASPVSSTSGITGSTTASFSYAFDLVEAFDLIELGGDDLRREPLQVRSHPSCQGRSRHPVQRAGNATTARCLHPCLRPLPACVFAPCHVTLAAMRRCLRHRPPCSPRRCLGPDACIHGQEDGHDRNPVAPRKNAIRAGADRRPTSVLFDNFAVLFIQCKDLKTLTISTPRYV